MNNNGNPPSAAFSTPTSQRTNPQGINIEQLADKVYRLMQTDLRLARARGGAARVRK